MKRIQQTKHETVDIHTYNFNKICYTYYMNYKNT